MNTRAYSRIYDVVKRGYAYVIQNERGRYFSEGRWEILGAPTTDGYDAIEWLAEQSWSNGKVGLIGCSSSAEWQNSETWPPADTETVTLYLISQGKANSVFGDGELSTQKPGPEDNPDAFTYDPKYPVPMHGGGFCCLGPKYMPGAFDQRQLESRHDILVYSTDPLEEGVEISGPIEITLYVSSDAKDTDFTVKLLDIYPDGRAHNLCDTIQRVRYREGYDKEVFMEKGKVYKLSVSSMSTSNYFVPGHRIRIEVSSSNFPRYARNLNIGGNNYDETEGEVAHNKVHHSAAYPSQIRVSVVKEKEGYIR